MSQYNPISTDPSPSKHWLEKDARAIRHLFWGCNLYIFFACCLTASLIFFLGQKKEDISLTMEHFSVYLKSTSPPHKIFLVGLIPQDTINQFSVQNVQGVKIYIKPNYRHLNRGERKILFHVTDVEMLPMKNSKIKNFQHPWADLKPFKLALFSAILIPSGEARHREELFQIMTKRDTTDVFEKAKIVFGQTNLLYFWFQKMFNQSDFFKKAGHLLD